MSYVLRLLLPDRPGTLGAVATARGLGDADILALAEVLAERDEGSIQITQAEGRLSRDYAFLERLAEVAQRPVLYNVVTVSRNKADVHRKPIAWVERCTRASLPVPREPA